MNNIEVKKEDIVNIIYFICALSQKLDGDTMKGVLGSKSDSIGGIFDRFINLVPESLIFNKIILPKVSNGKKIEVIPDYYIYDPKIAGVAPDVFGLIINDNRVNFIEYKNEWKKIENMPWIEIKSFKRNDYLVSLRDNKKYKDYLVLTNNGLRVDYLIPFLDSKIFSNKIYNNMVNLIDKKEIIKVDDKENINIMPKINYDIPNLGEISILKITSVKDFKEKSIELDKDESPIWINEIIEYTDEPRNPLIYEKLLNYVDEIGYNIYRFNENWYLKNNKKDTKMMDFYCSDISNIILKKKNQMSAYIEVLKKLNINGEYKKEGIYKITFKTFERNYKEKEYFMSKKVIDNLIDCEKDLLDKLEEIIKKN